MRLSPLVAGLCILSSQPTLAVTISSLGDAYDREESEVFTVSKRPDKFAPAFKEFPYKEIEAPNPNSDPAPQTSAEIFALLKTDEFEDHNLPFTENSFSGNGVVEFFD